LPAERTPLKDVLKSLVELGGRVVDSSPMYGTAESVVGDLAADLAITDKLFLATKVWTSGREAGVAQMEQSLKRLRAQRLDLIQIHNLLDWRTHLRTLREWKAAGRIRYLGVTHYTSSAYDELERVLRAETLDFVQVNYSLGEREAERRILPLARDRGVGRARQPAVRRGWTLPARARPGGAAVGGRVRLRQLGAVLPEVDPGEPGGDLRDPGHEPAAAHGRQSQGRDRQAPGYGDARPNGRPRRSGLSRIYRFVPEHRVPFGNNHGGASGQPRGNAGLRHWHRS
jgi:hypothetical protein